jgi:hypothetical protein
MMETTYLFHICSAIGMPMQMGTKRFETVFDYGKAGYDLAVTYACGHKGVLDPKAVSKHCIAKGLDTRMPAIKARLKCKACGSRDVRVAPQERT